VQQGATITIAALGTLRVVPAALELGASISHTRGFARFAHPSVPLSTTAPTRSFCGR
jgi:hypothetical protein